MKDTNKIYFNLKFVCDSGGAQTRTLREVYHFIESQMRYLINSNTDNVYFINILDGIRLIIILINLDFWKEKKNTKKS